MRALMVVYLLAVVTSGLIPFGRQQEEAEGALNPEFNYVYHRQTGSHFIEGSGSFPNVRTVDLPLAAAPNWVVGGAIVDSLTWAVLLDDGTIQGVFGAVGDELTISEPLPDGLPPGMPPVFTVNEIGAFVEQELPDDLAEFTHPAYQTDRITYVSNDGSIVLQSTVGDDQEELARLPFGAAADFRPVQNDIGTRAAFYVAATADRYVHGIMGDDLEGAGLIILELGDGAVPLVIDLPEDSVFEGLYPLWADVTGDGEQELITTVSNAREGAQIHVYNQLGELIAEGPAIGRGGRWRHQLAWGPFGPEGQNELVEVLTPHIGGIVGFYRYEDGALNLVAQQEGYTSHVIGSRNLEMAIGGDFDGDGQPEIVLPDQARQRLAGLAHTAEDTITEVWSLPLDGTLVTNLGALALPDGRLALAAGVETAAGYRLRVWLPHAE